MGHLPAALLHPGDRLIQHRQHPRHARRGEAEVDAHHARRGDALLADRQGVLVGKRLRDCSRRHRRAGARRHPLAAPGAFRAHQAGRRPLRDDCERLSSGWRPPGWPRASPAPEQNLRPNLHTKADSALMVIGGMYRRMRSPWGWRRLAAFAKRSYIRIDTYGPAGWRRDAASPSLLTLHS